MDLYPNRHGRKGNESEKNKNPIFASILERNSQFAYPMSQEYIYIYIYILNLTHKFAFCSELKGEFVFL
jgi:hypothetical protein